MNLKRRANGKGSAIYLGSGRAKPWMARITLGLDENGLKIRHSLGTFESQLEALFCLEQYHKNPKPIYVKTSKYNRIVSFSSSLYPLVPVNDPKAQLIQKINKEHYTFKQVFEIFKKAKLATKEEMQLEKEKNIKPNGKLSRLYTIQLTDAYNYSKKLHEKVYKSLVTSDFQTVINSAHNDGYSANFQSRLLLLFRHLDNYALQEDIINRGYAKFATYNKTNIKKVTKTIFSPEEILNWENFSSDLYTEEMVRDIIIFALYTGCRSSEILYLKTQNIHLDKGYLVTGVKTEAGINREIPIHSKTEKIIKKYYNNKNEFLFMHKGKSLKYPTLGKILRQIEEKNTNLGQHSMHECRHTFRTELERLGINHVTINAILGHKNKDTGLDVYTHISLEEKIAAVKMVDYSIKKLIVLKTS